ncbi:MAG: ADP-forming succinate--CoA ligase subunit beta [Gammaproteobacteria bacterium]|nr:ADP-forming succinate--CoA ligase subunit beta [Gammaproteobacteria bacterium]MCP5199364.1 ADP-forming succinate--CoA ligase subunit beta [Gammaproteobacteria bacterium]
MNLHEYQAKRLFADYGIPVQDGDVARSAAEAVECARTLGGDAWLVKAQVHAGGRGKAGGVKFTRDLQELEDVAGKLIGSQLVTKQSAPDGQPVNCVLIAAAADIAHELYLGAVVDRASRRVTFMASRAGGMDIEEVAATTPEKIVTASIDPVLGLQDFQCRQMGFALELDATQRKQLVGILHGLYRLFCERDLSLVEINPLAILTDGSLCALDAKINVDDNALYRQDIADWRDASQEDEKERRAKEFDLNYVTLDGNIACMVNGAGLAMATMDIIKLSGGDPANFLDVGGGTTAARVAEAFKIIVSDSKVKAILVNIFGGIVRCDLIAEGIITAVKEVGVNVPVVVRLEGTNVNEGKDMLAKSGLAITSAENLADAAAKVVAAAGGAN